MQATIYYDGDCPFCTRYVRFQRLQRNLQSLKLVDLRTAHAERERLQAKGFDVDKGMVLDLDGILYPGDEALQRLSLLSAGSAPLAHLSRLMLGTRIGSALAYPLLRLGRNATLLVLGRRRMVADAPGEQALQSLFGMAWGLFAYLHVLVYAWQYGAPTWVTTWAIAPLGVALFLFPLSRRIFLTLLLCMMVDAWRQMPTLSNHTFLKNAYLLALLFSGTWHALRGSQWREFLNDAAPAGRAALCCMYVFGVFHKINSGFLDPAVSCAVVLWRAMPGFLSWIDFPAFHYLAIYGTLIVETFILFCLLSRSWRHAGVVMGIGFHSLLAASDYAIYSPFSTLTIALHLLFLDRASALQIVGSTFWRASMTRLLTPLGLTVFGLWLGGLAWLSWNGSFGSVGVLWLPAVALLCYAIVRYGKSVPALDAGRVLWSRLWWLNAVSLLFFLGCISPYLGLKTAQSMSMFANLRVEAGASNHLILSGPPGPFKFLADTVEIVEVSGSPYLSRIRSQELRVTYYDLLDKLERNSDARVSYRRDEVVHVGQSAETLAGEISRILHPRWVRGFFHFTPVDLSTPKPCALDR